MSFFSKFSLGGKTENLIALDIGTEFAKALVFRTHIEGENVAGEILGVGRERQRHGNMQSGAVSDISGVIDTCRKAIVQAQEKAGIKKVKKAIIGIAGELVKGTTTTVHYERAKSESRMDLSELKTIIYRVQVKAFERIKQQIAWDTGQDDIDIKLINNRTPNDTNTPAFPIIICFLSLIYI